MSNARSISTHVLDVARGRPAAGVPVSLALRGEGDTWREIGRKATDDDGRLRDLVPDGTPLVEGTYRLVFNTASYFRSQKVEGFYPEVAVVFTVREATQHHHVPLLLSPYGYSTYRGS
jgi:5-hydroxyisourate hydrolase